MSASIANLLQRNEETSKTHTPIPTLAELKAAGSPGPKTMIVTCMDPRCIPEVFMNINIGEVVVSRNAGGNVRHAVRDISIMDQLFGLEELCIIHHTDCGTLSFTNDGLRSKVKANVEEKYWPEVDRIDWGANTDIVESVKGDLKWVKESPLMSDQVKKGAQGFVFDIKTGKVEKVEV
ncbi:carbonic anhydrase [Echria macrotheca]|uniref:Carbonic anhydrase n=1 Tax=Echria macrotheca TaxID=438768 RepID=A0AAJ0BH58_9PEZI|nr:carbonic anhydrase [Echria macrotheca]